MATGTKLTKDITLEDLTVTETKLNNTPPPEQRRILLFVASYLLQPIIDKFGTCAVSSAWRSPLVNKKIGGADNSQHTQAEAADIIPLKADINDVFTWCRKNLTFGQLILESKGGKKWIHISLPRIGKKNNQVLIFDGTDYRPWQEA